MDMPGLGVRAYATPWRRSVAFLIQLEQGHTFSVGTNVEMTRMDDPGEQIKPTFELQPEQAQQLMDDLWQAGLRPTEGTGSAGALAATQRHLQDMRALVGKAYEVPLSDTPKKS